MPGEPLESQFELDISDALGRVEEVRSAVEAALTYAGTTGATANLTKRALKIKAHKMRVRRERLDPQTGALLPAK